jgi:hypothetical protein
MGSDRSGYRLRIGGDEVDDLRHRAIAVRVVAVIAEPRQTALPVRRQQPQRIPSLGAPGVGDFAALQQDVIDGTLREAAAHGKSRMPGADDDGRYRVNCAASTAAVNSPGP